MKTVLTVDRSRVARAVIERHLERFDCVALEATTADEALAVARAQSPALIIADAAIHTVATRQGDAAYAAAPVIVLTTDHPAAAAAGDDPHVVATLRKPFDQASFDRAVEHVLGAPRSATRIAANAQLGGAR